MAREFKRSDRVADLIQREISTLMITSMKDPRLSMVTITGAKVTNDLRHATIYFSLTGDEAKRKVVQKGLESAAGFFRKHLREVTELRLIPDLHFSYDESIDRGERIEKLLREVRSENDK